MQRREGTGVQKSIWKRDLAEGQGNSIAQHTVATLHPACKRMINSAVTASDLIFLPRQESFARPVARWFVLVYSYRAGLTRWCHACRRRLARKKGPVAALVLT